MKKQLPAADELRRLLSYDPKTGILSWRIWHGGTAFADTEAGNLSPYGYRRVNCCGGLHMSHRLIWKLVTGADPIGEIDHKNGKRADNRWNNLRQASHADNAHNSKMPLTNTSGFKGVHWHSGANKWRATIKNGGPSPIHLGYFECAKDAHAAYCTAAQKLHGEFARTV